MTVNINKDITLPDKGVPVESVAAGQDGTIQEWAVTAPLVSSIPVEDIAAGQDGTIQEWAITAPLVSSIPIENISAGQSGTIQVWAITAPLVSSIPIETITVPEIADVDFYKIYDAGTGTYTDYTTEAIEDTANDAPLLPPDPIQINDAHYIGFIKKFDSVIYLVGTLGEGTYQGSFEYYTGLAWATLSTYFGGAEDLTNFRNGDQVAIYLLPPVDMHAIDIDGDVARWVRYRITSIGSDYVQPLGTRMYVTPLSDISGQVIRINF